MNAITIPQPRASLIALGAIRYDSRSWSHRYRGPIAIHARRWIDEEFALQIFRHEPFKAIFREALIQSIWQLPRGMVIAYADLAGIESGYDLIGRQRQGKMANEEFAFSDFSRGLKAFRFENVRPLANPVRVQGERDLWSWTPPAGWEPQFVAPPAVSSNPES